MVSTTPSLLRLHTHNSNLGMHNGTSKSNIHTSGVRTSRKSHTHHERRKLELRASRPNAHIILILPENGRIRALARV